MFKFFSHIARQINFHHSFQEALLLAKQGYKIEAFDKFNNLLNEQPANPYVRHQLLILAEQLHRPIELPKIFEEVPKATFRP